MSMKNYRRVWDNEHPSVWDVKRRVEHDVHSFANSIMTSVARHVSYVENATAHDAWQTFVDLIEQRMKKYADDYVETKQDPQTRAFLAGQFAELRKIRNILEEMKK